MTENEPENQAGGSQELTDQTDPSIWPACPSCKKRRLTVCPACQEASEEFPLADYQADGMPVHNTRTGQAEANSNPQKYPLLECTTCSEVFRPTFYRHCAWCGFGFVDGKTIDLKGFYHQLERRPTMVLIALCVLGVVMSGYFYWVLN